MTSTRAARCVSHVPAAARRHATSMRCSIPWHPQRGAVKAARVCSTFCFSVVNGAAPKLYPLPLRGESNSTPDSFGVRPVASSW